MVNPVHSLSSLFYVCFKSCFIFSSSSFRLCHYMQILYFKNNNSIWKIFNINFMFLGCSLLGLQVLLDLFLHLYGFYHLHSHLLYFIFVIGGRLSRRKHQNGQNKASIFYYCCCSLALHRNSLYTLQLRFSLFKLNFILSWLIRKHHLLIFLELPAINVAYNVAKHLKSYSW